jgi:hypothetical protein
MGEKKPHMEDCITQKRTKTLQMYQREAYTRIADGKWSGADCREDAGSKRLSREVSMVGPAERAVEVPAVVAVRV